MKVAEFPKHALIHGILLSLLIITVYVSHGKIIDRTSHWIRSTRNKESVTHPSRDPGRTTLPTLPLPLKPARLSITPAEITPAQAITSTGATVVMKDKIEMLTTPKQIKRYEKYLERQKEKLQEDTKL